MRYLDALQLSEIRISSSGERVVRVCVCVAVSGTRRNMSATAVESRHRDNNDVSDVKWNDSGIVIGKPRPPAVYYSV